MATLEKIRSKSVLLFTIIIIALLAFILGDFLTSGRTYFGPGSTIAKVNGAKVELNDYQNLTSQVDEAYRNVDAGYNRDQIEQGAIDELLVKSLLDKQYEGLDIKVSNKTISNIMLSDVGNMLLSNAMAATGLNPQAIMSAGITDSKSYYDAMKNPKKFGLDETNAAALSATWAYAENYIDKQMSDGLFMMLLDGLYTGNDLDARAIYDNQAKSTKYAYVAKGVMSVKDDEVKVSDDDIKKVYEAQKGKYRLDEKSAEISYIKIDFTPSDADFAEGQKAFETVYSGLVTEEGVSAARRDNRFLINEMTMTANDITESRDQVLMQVLPQLDSLKVGSVKRLSAMGGYYAMVKVNGINEKVDRITYSVLPIDNDSVLATLTTENFNEKAGRGANNKVSMVHQGEQIDEKFRNALLNTPINQITTISDSVVVDQSGKKELQRAAIMVTERPAAVKVYDLATITFEVSPSTATINSIKEKLNAFVANNATAKAFNENAEKAGYTIQHAVVSPSRYIAGAPSSRAAVKWALDNKAGKVSPVFTFNNPEKQFGTREYYLAVAIDDVYSDYIPYTSPLINDQLKTQALNEKKAEKLVNDFKGKAKDINGYAQAMGTTVSEGSATFSQPGVDAKLAAQLANAKKGELVGPFAGNNAVYVIQVTEVEDLPGRAFDAKQEMRSFNGLTKGAFTQTFYDMNSFNPQTGKRQPQPYTTPSLDILKGDNQVKNNILFFTRDEN
jgi:peptidyl-prolyl cis-trans isomerase D